MSGPRRVRVDDLLADLDLAPAALPPVESIPEEVPGSALLRCVETLLKDCAVEETSLYDTIVNDSGAEDTLRRRDLEPAEELDLADSVVEVRPASVRTAEAQPLELHLRAEELREVTREPEQSGPLEIEELYGLGEPIELLAHGAGEDWRRWDLE